MPETSSPAANVVDEDPEVDEHHRYDREITTEQCARAVDLVRLPQPPSASDQHDEECHDAKKKERATAHQGDWAAGKRKMNGDFRRRPAPGGQVAK